MVDNWSLLVVRDQSTLRRALVAMHGAKTARSTLTSVIWAFSPKASSFEAVVGVRKLSDQELNTPKTI